MTQNIFSSAKKKSEKQISAYKLSVNILNNKGPKMESGGTPESKRNGKGNFPRMDNQEDK
jgi:hypothetical protein